MQLQMPVSALPAGKQKLIAAALRISARDGSSLSSLGLRELAREAGLNHNTFYRHFREPSELVQAVAESIAAQFMVGMKELRLRAARRGDATRDAVEYFLDFVKANPDVFIVGVRELHSAGSPTRTVLLRVLESIARESEEQISALGLAPGVERAALLQVALDITYYLFCHALDLLDRPRERKAIAAQMVQYIRRQFLGAMAR